MIGWLKFFPFEGRVDNKPEEVRGPYFSKMRKSRWFFSDNTLYFLSPLSNPILGFSGGYSSVDRLSPGNSNILEVDLTRVYNSSESAVSEWDFYQFYSDVWYFVGPWFSGYQARLKAIGLLVCAKNSSSFSDKNIFHPRTFEAAIANYLDAGYGHKTTGGKPKYRGPLNWKVLPISPAINAVVCDVHEIGNGSKENPLLHRLVFVPVDPRSFIQINFDFSGTQIYRDEVRAKPLFKLCDSIVNSIRLDVGKKTQAEWDKVKATCPDMSITETFGELPWPLKVEGASTGAVERDITPTQEALEDYSTSKTK